MTAPYSMDLRERAMARKAAGETNREIAAAPSERVDAVTGGGDPAVKEPFAAHDKFEPGGVLEDVAVTAGARLALAGDQPEGAEIVDCAGDRGSADVKLCGEFLGGEAAGIGHQQSDEHERGHLREAGVDER